MILPIIGRYLFRDDVLRELKSKLIGYLRELAQQSENEIDDALVDILEKSLDMKIIAQKLYDLLRGK
jgi:hypothetical protein